MNILTIIRYAYKTCFHNYPCRNFFICPRTEHTDQGSQCHAWQRPHVIHDFCTVHHRERWKQRNMGFQSSSNLEKQQQRLLFCRLAFSYFHDGQLWQAVFQDGKWQLKNIQIREPPYKDKLFQEQTCSQVSFPVRWFYKFNLRRVRLLLQRPLHKSKGTSQRASRWLWKADTARQWHHKQCTENKHHYVYSNGHGHRLCNNRLYQP